MSFVKRKSLNQTLRFTEKWRKQNSKHDLKPQTFIQYQETRKQNSTVETIYIEMAETEFKTRLKTTNFHLRSRNTQARQYCRNTSGGEQTLTQG